ncbi:radical SAM family heme chaperone HemW [Psychrobacter sp. P11G5]|uniref:radical SAM family heme chaperone HemW n=1 Tax=Psychrobacter sp. P11G5 TaxID=1699624 RepID=UPI00078E1568|nr:radical SAM family heme chaperone HemW [Psychrobacter sp. P11G5]AMN67404.1 coproporphyrinogen III oxidase [Psychrobacter sp. P11G5]
MSISEFDNITTPSNATSTSCIEAIVIPLALYIHIPWCVKKCPYCDFNSHELGADVQLSMYDEYVDTLLLDAQMQQPLTQGRQISSIFIGGGTPSLLPIVQYQRLFAGLRACFEFADDIEVTMEANPGTLEHAPFAEYLKVGINRLSIGVQSFAADKLQTLGRIHDPKQATAAIHAARAAGFERVNVDLMHGLPQQSLSEALYDIQTAHDAGATHISWYQLTIEPNTVFYRSQPILPDEDSLADIEDAGQALLQRLGYDNYEVSAWAGESDKPCRHNVNYWQFGDYLAIGAGAHGKITINDGSLDNSVSGLSKDNETLLEAGIYRFSKSRSPKDYMTYQDIPKMVNWLPIADDELVSEFMLNALRLYDGVTWSLFESRTGLSYESIALQVNKLVEQGLLMNNTELLQPTLLGRRYLNQILHAFL